MPVRAGAKLFDADDNEIGLVTSGGFGPTFNGPVAIGMINADADNFPLVAQVRAKNIPMEIHKFPFVPHQYKR